MKSPQGAGLGPEIQMPFLKAYTCLVPSLSKTGPLGNSALDFKARERRGT